MRICLTWPMAAAALLLSGSRLGAETIRVSGYVGAHRLTYEAVSVPVRAEFSIKGPADYIAVTEVYPDTPEPVVYRYSISGKGMERYERTHKATGFGPVTYFLNVTGGKLGPIVITNRHPHARSNPVLISCVWAVTANQLQSLLDKYGFTIMGLIPGGSRQEQDKWVKMLADSLAARPEYAISRGFSSEIKYANQASEEVESDIQTCADWSHRHGIPSMLGLVSWWSGTPLRVPDGEGGTFGDVTYQQVCYSPDVELPENPDLKALLGDRHNRHYGLSVPNQWSNTPWLTMNSVRLNNYRYRRMADAVDTLHRILRDDSSWLLGLFLENEPRYWDTDCEAYNPKTSRRGSTVWADFNPLVIDDARRDGIILDPTDGLSNEELAWLHRNVGKYNQDTVDAFLKVVAGRAFCSGVHVYTHSLQLAHMFPGGPINHPASEWAYARGARTGIEGMWSRPSDFYRVREWGRWANVNREENDGRHIDEHLWDLRVAYAMGADLYNSYNWHAIGAERFFAYVDEFLKDFPVVSLPPAEFRVQDDRSVRIRTPMKLQAFDRIHLPVKVARDFSGSVFAGVTFGDGSCFFSERQTVALEAGQRKLAISFTTPAECSSREEALVVLHVLDEKGAVAPDAVSLAADSTNEIRLSLDLRTQRGLSLAVISRRT